RSAASVVALEPAAAMTDILEKKIDAAGVNNITVDRRTWQAVDLVADGWQGAFDLVFASMTPGIDGPASLRKMIAAARGYCYLSAFSGQGWQQWYAELWRTVFNESLTGHPNDIIHPFNLLYAMGYRPELRFSFWERETSLSREEAMEDFSTHLEGFTQMTPEIEARIARFVDERCDNGSLVQQRKGCQGMMAWDVHQKVMER
ncbi:MAG: class I SAM-dependent methyltransferase, partial [Desulfosarcinaceae bacterium]